MVELWKYVKRYTQPRPQTKVLIITNLRHTANRIRIFTELEFRFCCMKLYNSYPFSAQYSRSIRWVFLQRCSVRDIQGTFREYFKEKGFLKRFRWRSYFCVKSVWFDINKCWSFGKFQQSQSNVSRVFEEHSTDVCLKNIL